MALVVAGRKGTKGDVPGASGGAPKGGAAIFLPHEIYKNSVSSVESGIGMEGQIMCVEQCKIFMSSVAFLGFQNAPKFF